MPSQAPLAVGVTLAPMTRLLGGTLCPLGLRVQFVEAEEPDVAAALRDIVGRVTSTETGVPLPAALTRLLPLQAPWTRAMTAQVGRWTAIVNNHPSGGDGTAPGPAISDALKVRCVVASSVPRHGPGHAQTQLEVMGPTGVPPLMEIRSISATATDGRWGWDAGGEPFPFEDTDRYAARLTQDRFDRELLLRYVASLGIPVDDECYGLATLYQIKRRARTREVTLEQERRLFGL